MAWGKGSANGRAILTETVQLSSSGTTYSSAFTVPLGETFTALINTLALNSVGAVTTDLEGSQDSADWQDIDTSFAADCDTATIASVHAITDGDYPFYRLSFDSAGADVANSIVVVIMAHADAAGV